MNIPKREIIHKQTQNPQKTKKDSTKTLYPPQKTMKKWNQPIPTFQ